MIGSNPFKNTELLPSGIKYAPITSADVEHSLSRFKNILNPIGGIYNLII